MERIKDNRDFSEGEHLAVGRGGYEHHGIYVGGGEVIHYSGDVKNKAGAQVMRASIATFRKDGVVRSVSYGRCDSAEAAIDRAVSRLGEATYDLVFNNCEHFARWCKTGNHKSEQVKDVVSNVGGAAGGTGAVAAAVLGGVSGAGSVAGLSGAGIMSGLAAAGGTVGTGAVGGVVVLAAAPVAVTTYAMRKVLEDDEALPAEERGARKAGRIATFAGAGAGAVGSVAAISSAGSVAGLGATGITSGLCAIGTVAGGGMAAGTMMTVAAPAVAAAAVGYGAYRVWRWFTVG